MILHTVNKSPSQSNCLSSCLRVAPQDGALLLLEDGVYAATQNTETSDLISTALINRKVFALTSDVKARGLLERLIPGIDLVDYQGFVKLTEQYDTVQSWY